MIIRDGYEHLNGNEKKFRVHNSLQIINENGDVMFDLCLDASGCLRISGGSVCKINGVLFDDVFSIIPVASNVIKLQKNLLSN